MLIADGGGGYSGTNFWAYEVEDMWAMLKDHETDNHWKQISGWQKSFELTSTHLFRLKDYRDNLVQAWSPKKSNAAKAYVDRLDYLIESVQQTYDTAISNYTTASGAIGALTTARYELEQVYNDYMKKKRAANSSSNSGSIPSSEIMTPSPSPSPSGVSRADQAELDRLTDRARGIMFSLGSELSLAQVQLKTPPTYKPATFIGDQGNPDVYGGGGATPPPAIPPIMTVPTGGYTTPAHSAPPPPIHPVPAPTAPSAGPILGGGPVLGGVGTPLPPAPPPVTALPPNVITPPTVPAPPVVGGPLPPIPPGLPGPGYGGGHSTGIGPTTGINPATGSLFKPGAGGLPGAPRPMPPGGMIGGTPGAGLGQPGALTGPARRINPVGGMIGGERTSSGMTPMGGAQGATGTGRSPMGPTGRAGHRRNDEEHGQHWDPDNPWQTDEGVAPVVLPAQEVGRIDPGPAIGFDR
jgi:hypothetical protein